MSESQFCFSDTSMSGEDRLADFVALERGVTMALENLLTRVKGYHELLEEEVEDSPAAVKYLSEADVALKKADFWIKALQNKSEVAQQADTLAMNVMLEGIVARCTKISKNKKSFRWIPSGDDAIVRGSLFQLQDFFMELVQGLNQWLNWKSTVINTQAIFIQEEFFKLHRLGSASGRYLVITIAEDEVEFVQKKQVPYLGAFLDWMSTDSSQLLFLHGYGVVLGHGGEIFFTKDNDNLNAVSILLPLEEQRKEMAAPHNFEDKDLMGTETILLVDDEDMIWDVIIDMLQELGYSVILAENGADAVEIYGANPGEIDLVLLDMLMPEMNGHDAFFKLKEINTEVKVLLSSGYVSEEEAAVVLEAGAVGFLKKPYKMTELAKVIRSIFDGE